MTTKNNTTIPALHTIVGYGPVGQTLAQHLTHLGFPVRIITRTPHAPSHPNIEHVHADLMQLDDLIQATQGSQVIYAAMNPPYTHWPQLFPVMQANLLQAAQRHQAVYISVDNLYGYGPVTGPITETTPQCPTTRKGRTRAEMTQRLLDAHQQGKVRAAAVRASDFIGPNVTQSAYGASFIQAARQGKRIQLLGNPDTLHTVTFVPDFVRALANVAQTEQAWGQVWHAPSAPAITQRQLAQLTAQAAGGPTARVSVTPTSVMKALGLVVPMLREVAEMNYLFERPLIMSDQRYQQMFGEPATPLETALHATVQLSASAGSQGSRSGVTV